MDDAHAGPLGVGGAAEADGTSADGQFALVVGDDAGEALHERAFSGPVLADEGVELPLGHVHGHVAQGHHAGKAFGDVSNRDDRFRWHEEILGWNNCRLTTPRLAGGLARRCFNITVDW